jgi:hypothetical protein
MGAVFASGVALTAGKVLATANDKFDDHGYLLAEPAGPFPADTPITAGVREALIEREIREMLIYYPLIWVNLRQWMVREGITRQQLSKAVEIYVTSVIPDPAYPKDTLEQTMSRLGAGRVPWQAYSIVATVMMATMTGLFYTGIRQATIAADRVSPVMEELKRAGVAAADYFAELADESKPGVGADVLTRPECIFNYCPHPDKCLERCQSPGVKHDAKPA